MQLGRACHVAVLALCTPQLLQKVLVPTEVHAVLAVGRVVNLGLFRQWHQIRVVWYPGLCKCYMLISACYATCLRLVVVAAWRKT